MSCLPCFLRLTSVVRDVEFEIELRSVWRILMLACHINGVHAATTTTAVRALDHTSDYDGSLTFHHREKVQEIRGSHRCALPPDRAGAERGVQRPTQNRMLRDHGGGGEGIRNPRDLRDFKPQLKEVMPGTRGCLKSVSTALTIAGMRGVLASGSLVNG